MAGYSEDRPNHCVDCKYFFPDSDESINTGYCFRRAPTRFDYNIGGSMFGLGMFSHTSFGDITVCGDYARLPGFVPTPPT
jgi:hypothetical protein